MFVRHDIRPEFLAELTGLGTYGAVDVAVVNGVCANLRNGRLAGLDGDAEDESGEKLILNSITRQWELVASASDQRTFWGNHDRLPWHAAFMDRFSYGRLLQHVLRSAAYNWLPGYSMPTDGTKIDFRHKDTGKLGWENKQGSGLTGHHTYMMENVIRLMGLYPGSRPSQIFKYWDSHIKATFSNTKDVKQRALDRNTHALFVQVWMAYCYTGDDYYRQLSLALAHHLTQVPLSQHKTQLNDPLWPHTLSEVLGRGADVWIVEAADWATDAGQYGLTLSGLAWLITKINHYLQRNAQTLWDYSTGYLRVPGLAHDWIGQEVGRTGEVFSTQWPFYRWVLGQAGSSSAFIAKRPSLNSIPLSRDPVGGTGGGLVIMTGSNLNDCAMHYRSWIGDTYGGTLTPQTPAATMVQFPGPYGSHDGWATKEKYPDKLPLRGAPITKMLLMAYQQLGGPLTQDPTESYQLEANKWYELSSCYAWLLTGSSFMQVKPLGEHITIYDGLGKPILGMMPGLGLSNIHILSLLPNKTLIDARGPQYARWAFKLDKPGIWSFS